MKRTQQKRSLLHTQQSAPDIPGPEFAPQDFCPIQPRAKVPPSSARRNKLLEERSYLLERLQQIESELQQLSN